MSWVAPDDNGAAITDYDVNYKQASASNWSNHPFTGTGTSTTITSLTNGVAYVVRVRAQNAAGESDWRSRRRAAGPAGQAGCADAG